MAKKKKTAAGFRSAAPLAIRADILAEIEDDALTYPKQIGQVWIQSTWLTLDEATALRDWLNKVIP